jgi:hypothetical protein
MTFFDNPVNVRVPDAQVLLLRFLTPSSSSGLLI